MTIEWPTLVLGVLGVILLAFQVRIMARQTDILNQQTALTKQQADWRVIEAVGAFVTLAFDLTDEFRKANVLPGTVFYPDEKSRARAALREASRTFAPLGARVVIALTQAAHRVDDYFAAAHAYNHDSRGRAGQQNLETVQRLREQVGHDLNAANLAIPEADRWRYDNGKDYDFRALCSLPAAYLKAIGSDSSGEGDA